MESLGLLKDLSCDICGKSGKTNTVIFGNKGIICCSDHTKDEIDVFRKNKNITCQPCANSGTISTQSGFEPCPKCKDKK